MSQKVKALTAIPAVPDRTRDPQTTFNAKTVAWMEAQKRNTDDFNANVPMLNELFTKADQAVDAADESRENAAVATLKAGEAAASAQSALESKEAAQTARTGAEAARDAAVAVAGVDIATTEKAGLVKVDGVSLKMKDAAGKVAVEDVLYNGSISLVNSGALGKAKYIKLFDHFNVDEDDFDLVLVHPVGHGGTYPPWIKNDFIYIKQFYYSRNSETDIGNRMQIAFGYGDSSSGQRYCRGGAWSAWARTIKETDLATSSTLGVVKVGKGLTASGDGTLCYAGMGAAKLSVGRSTRLTSSSARNFVLTATVASPNVFLPEPSTLYAGEQFTFFAEGDNIRVRDFQGQAVGPVLARGKAYLFTLINKTTGEWARAEFSASGTSGDGGSLGFQPSISAPVIFSDVAEAYSTDIELETGRVLHFGAPGTSGSGIAGGTLSLVSVTGWGAVSVKNTPLTLPQDFILHDLFKLSSSLCCVLAKDAKTNKKFAVIPVDVSGATAVVGKANILTTTGTLGKPIFSRVDDARALLVYGDGTSLYARLYSFSGSTVTAAAPVLVASPVKNLDYLNVQRMDDTRWLLRTGDFVLQLLEVSGASITVGEPVTFTPDAAWINCNFAAVSPAPGGNVLIYVGFQRQDESTSQYVYVSALLVYTSSGLVLTEGTLTEVSGGYYNSRFLNIAGRMFLWSNKTGSSNDYYLVPVTVSNGTATAGAECLIFTTSESFYNNLTLLTYTGDTYAIMSVYKKRDDERIYFLRGGFKISPNGSLTKANPSGPATAISNITWGLNPCIQAFPGGRYVYANNYPQQSTTVSILNGSLTVLCSATVAGFAPKPYVSSSYLYSSVFPTGEFQTLVILNQYNSKKPAWALFTL